MRNILFLLLICFNSTAFAQTYYTIVAADGSANRVAIVQFGPDTIVMNQPFKAKDKIGMSLDFSKFAGIIKCTAHIRSKSPVLLKDSIILSQSHLCFTGKNGDTINFVPHKRSLKEAHEGIIRTDGIVTIFLTAYISSTQVMRLRKMKLDNIKFYTGDETYADMPVTTIEKGKLKNALNYLSLP